MPTVNTIHSAVTVETVMGSGSTDGLTGEDTTQALLLLSRQNQTASSHPTPLDAIYLFLLCGQQTFSTCFCSQSRFPFGSFQLVQDQEAWSPNGENRQAVKAASHLPTPCKLKTTPPAYLPGASCRHLQKGRNRATRFIFIRGHGWQV